MIKLIKPYISFDEVESEFRDVFDSGWFTKGKNVDRFRQELVNYTGAAHSFLTTSATTALWMSLKVLGIGPGDEVIVSDFSFPASANVIEDLGAVPVFADVDLDTFNMLPTELERKISEQTKAVMFVDALGNPSGITEIKEICQNRGIPLIEDAACAIGSSENSVKCGSIADFSCFSFHPRKLLTTGEGGAITTNNDAWADNLEIKLNHGASIQNGVHDFIDCGYNFRMSELQAVMGIKQLEKLDQIVAERNEIRELYIKHLEPVGFKAQRVSEGVCHNVQSLVFVVPECKGRNELSRYLREHEIETTIGTYALSNTSYYKSKYQSVQPNAGFLQNHTITFPCFQGVDVEQVCSSIMKFVKQ